MERARFANHGQDRRRWLAAAGLVLLALFVVFWLVERGMHREDPSIAAGRADFARYCAECHGPEGRGDGPMAERLHPRPANLRVIARRSGGEFDLAEGTIYPALHRLEASGLLTSRWDVVGGRRRRVYALSSSGRRAVVDRRATWASFSRAVDAVFGGEALEAG